MKIIQLNQIPKNIEIAGMKVNLQERFLYFMNGKQKPINGYYESDFQAWIDYEGIVNLRSYCQF